MREGVGQQLHSLGHPRPIETYLTAVGWHLDGMVGDEIGVRLAAAFAHWGARLPLTDVWQRLSNHTIAEELRFLCGWLLPTHRRKPTSPGGSANI